MTSTRTFIIGTLLSANVLTTMAQDGPTMGWSSWNTYSININEALIKRQADAMVEQGYYDAGYRYINIDDGFFGGRDSETGQLLIHPTRFPNGLKPVVDYIHGKGLKAGIYSDAGHNTCGNYYNGDAIAQGVGFYEHDQQDADFYFNELGFDFIKVDFCGGDGPQNSERLTLDERTRYTAISEAIRKTGRTDVRLNVCRWNYPGTWVNDIAFSWRTTVDINCSWNSVRNIINENLYLSAYCRDHHFNDMDMLEVGRGLTAEEDKTHFGMWCIMNSPLLIGCDMTTANSTARELMTNTELIALNQDPLHQQAYVAALSNSCYIIVKDIEQHYGLRRAFAIYNPTDAAKTATVSFADLDLAGRIRLRDLFQHRDLDDVTNGTFTINVPAHGTRIYLAEAEQRTERIRYEAETAYISDYQEIRNNQAERTGIYEYATYCSAGLKAGWLGMSAQNDLVFEHVYSEKGGEYTLTIAYISGENRTLRVSVNGGSAQNITGMNSGGWSTVAKKELTIHLEAGDNVIRLYNTSAWMPDIDYIDVKKVPEADAVRAPHATRKNKKVYRIDGTPLPSSDHAVESAPAGIYIIDNHKVLQR